MENLISILDCLKMAYKRASKNGEAKVENAILFAIKCTNERIGEEVEKKKKDE